jgi:PAS domain S-box-containing protein
LYPKIHISLVVFHIIPYDQPMKTPARYSQTMRLDLPLDTGTRAATQSEAPKINAAKNAPNTQTEFDQLLETLYDAVILTDRNGNLVTANQRTLDFLQIELDVLLQCNIAHIIAGASQNILDTVLGNIKEHRFTLIQAFCIRSDKSTFSAEVSVTSIVRNGQDCLCFSIRDTTLRRQVEERLRIEGEAIRNAGDGIVITDTEGIITYANPAVGRLWNIDDPEDVTEQPILTLFPESQAIEDAVNAAVEKGSWNGELEANKPDGDAFFLQVHITASLDEDECITHLVFSFADITRRRQGEIALLEYQNHLEDLIRQRTANLESTNAELMREIEERRTIENQLREAIQKLREHDTAKSTFVSNVSHELRTPLTSLIKSLENLMRGVVGEVSDPVASYFSMMLEDCWRLERTIHDILDLSRIEKGTFKLVRHPVPFTCLMQRTAESIRMSAESIPLTYTVSRSPLGGFVDCDGTKIERVLINILSNALKFTPPNGSCTVTFEQIERNGKLRSPVTSQTPASASPQT